MMVQANQTFRSSAKNPLERKAVEDSFARSILWGFEVQAESSGRVLVNATDFFLRDVNGAAGSLRPGNYRVDRTRSAFYLPNTKNFPKNTEVDVTLTFANQAWATWPLEKDLTSASYTIFAAATFLLPLNFLAFSILKEEAIGTLRATLRLLLFLFQPFVVLWLCDPANRDMAAALTTPTGGWPRPSTPVPLPALLVFLISGVMHMVRFAIQRHPMDAGAAWALA